jgi:hypothetical protein
MTVIALVRQVSKSTVMRANWIYRIGGTVHDVNKQNGEESGVLV